nr:hypothetical protein [Tanacetum cinerariifolium]
STQTLPCGVSVVVARGGWSGEGGGSVVWAAEVVTLVVVMMALAVGGDEVAAVEAAMDEMEVEIWPEKSPEEEGGAGIVVAASKWLPKLLGFDYEIEYKKGKENVVVDALSRIQVQSELFSLLSEVTTNEFMDAVTRKGKWVVRADTNLRTALVKHFHSSTVRGHGGVQATTKRISLFFYWKGLRKLVNEVVRTCDVCQKNKADLSPYPGLLQPLPIPIQIWHDISIDFIDALPVSQGKSTILVVMDRLISDRDKVFMSLFWQSLFKMLQVELKMSTAYHPQTDGQTKVVNKCLECYLRCMTGESPKEWTLWLPLAEYWYNTNYHSAIKTTLFEAVYEQPPALHVPYMAKDSRVELVDRTLQAREKAIQMLQFNLRKAQDIMKS